MKQTELNKLFTCILKFVTSSFLSPHQGCCTYSHCSKGAVKKCSVHNCLRSTSSFIITFFALFRLPREIYMVSFKCVTNYVIPFISFTWSMSRVFHHFVTYVDSRWVENYILHSGSIGKTSYFRLGDSCSIPPHQKFENYLVWRCIGLLNTAR